MTAESVPSFPLTARLDSELERFAGESELIHSLVRAHGSPLHFVLPDQVRGNVSRFNETFQKLRLEGILCLARKANRSAALAAAAEASKAWIDVSSVGELMSAFRAGFAADRIEATGPKGDEFIRLLIKHGVLIQIDSAAELTAIVSTARSSQRRSRVKILFRLSGFLDGSGRVFGKESRFGIPFARLEEALRIASDARDIIDIRGVAFHLDSTALNDRVVAIEGAISALHTLAEAGFTPSILGIGGGFKVNYLASREEWDAFTSGLRDVALGRARGISWQEHAFGWYSEGGKLRGNLNIYQFYDSKTGPGFLEVMLTEALPRHGNRPAAEILAESGIAVLIEPGRAMMDQCGCTAARVLGTRESSHGSPILLLEMKRQDITFLEQDFLVDPLLIPQSPRANREPKEYFMAGMLCLESDIISRRLVRFSSEPQPGDLILFPNTAGYNMDFSATESIMHPAGIKIAVDREGPVWRWFDDDRYVPRNHPG